MNKESPFNILLKTDQENREIVSKRIYDEAYNETFAENSIKPQSKRRKKRISIYKRIIGQNHEKILEIGCGLGDLTYALRYNAKSVVGVDISSKVIAVAKTRKDLLSIEENCAAQIEFLQMSAVNLNFPPATFDYVVSTSMVEHLHPDDVVLHFKGVCRILKDKGHYLVWCPNLLGHHKDREAHLSMFSYEGLVEKMQSVGFSNFQSTLFTKPPMINAHYKIFLEKVFCNLRIKILWSHLGLRNILLVATK